MNMLSLAPSLLISMPQLTDGNFSRTVVLLCRHNDEGAFGLVVNRPIVTTGRVIVGVDPPVSHNRELQVWIGGPVQPEHSWILVGADGVAEAREAEQDEGGLHIADGLYLSTSAELLSRVLEPEPPPRTRLMIGYSGWGPGQLESELQVSAWLISDIDRGLIFDTPPDRMWEAALRRLGADPAALQISRGVH